MNFKWFLRFFACFLAGMVCCEIALCILDHRTMGHLEHTVAPEVSTNHKLRSQHRELPAKIVLKNIEVLDVKTQGNMGSEEAWADPPFVRLLRSPNQTMSCFPRTINGSYEAWAANSCGVLVDGYSIRSHMSAAPYKHLTNELIRDLLSASSEHLPYFHEFPRVVVVHRDGVDEQVMRDGQVLSNQNRVEVRIVHVPDVGSTTQDGWVPSFPWGFASRVLLVVQPAVALAATANITTTTFDVMMWTPFERTLFVNASFSIPGRRKVSPPTLLFPLLDHFDVLFAPIPFMEEALLKLQRAGCWPLARDFALPQGSGGFLSKQFYVGSMYHPGFTMYRRTKRVLLLWRAAAAYARERLELFGEPSTALLCETNISGDLLMRDAFALSTALRAVRTTLDGSAWPSVSVIDPIHCADTRYGLDPCNRIVNRPSRQQKKERFQTFRCDNFRFA